MLKCIYPLNICLLYRSIRRWPIHILTCLIILHNALITNSTAFDQNFAMLVGLLVFLCSLEFVSCLYFHQKESEEKCFIEDVPSETLVTGTYKLMVFDDSSQIFLPANRFGVQVLVSDPQGSVTLDRVYAAEGRFVFTSHHPGEHVICLRSNSSAWYGGSQMRIYLAFSIGQHDYSGMTSQKKVPELLLRMKQLLDHTDMIRKEQEYQRVREESFRNVSENTHHVVWVYATAQCFLAVGVGIFQMRHLRRFFLIKKIL